jgi:hypothetical protein
MKIIFHIEYYLSSAHISVADEFLAGSDTVVLADRK